MKKTVILISAKLQSGKNQLASYIKEELASKSFAVSSESYAKALKAQCTEDFGRLWGFLEGKRQELLALGTVPPELISWMSVKPENLQEDKTDLTRLMLQIYGTEIFRNRVDGDYWVKKCVDSVNLSKSDFVMITDVRYPNEVEAFLDWAKDRSGMRRVVLVRVERPGYVRDENDPAHKHPSESALDEFPCWDYVVDNVGTLEDLRSSAQAIVSELVGA